MSKKDNKQNDMKKNKQENASEPSRAKRALDTTISIILFGFLMVGTVLLTDYVIELIKGLFT